MARLQIIDGTAGPVYVLDRFGDVHPEQVRHLADALSETLGGRARAVRVLCYDGDLDVVGDAPPDTLQALADAVRRAGLEDAITAAAPR